MYSYEKRKKAVELYVQRKLDGGAACKELGYPSGSTLKRWLREYEKRGSLPEGYRPRYSQEEQSAAVAYYTEHGRNLSRTCKALGYPSIRILREWVRQRDGQHSPPVKRGRDPVHYTDKRKREIVVSIASGEKTAGEYRRSLGVHSGTVSKWKRRLLGEDYESKMAKKQPPEPAEGQADQAADLKGEVDALRRERDSLQRQVRQLEMEKDIIEKAAEILKKGRGIDIDTLTNREKAMVVDALAGRHPVADLLGAVHMASSSYFYQLKAMKRDKYEQVRKLIRIGFDENEQCFGYRRIHTYLATTKGITISEKVVARLMAEEGIVVPRPRRKRYSSYQGDLCPVVENVVNRDFHADAPNEKWLSDITEFSIPAGKVYLSPMVDCFDGGIVSWTRGTSPNARLVNTMLDKAVATLPEGAHPVVHTDRGCHYQWDGWIRRMDANGLRRSMSRKGCSPDNAACEGFFGRMKNEMFYHRRWTGVSLEDFCARIDKYITWYNEKRIKMSLGGRSPLEYRRVLGLAS